MTNKEAKEKAIRKAWGEYYDRVKNDLDERGFCKVYSHQESILDISNDYNIPVDFILDCHNTKDGFRPYCIKDIEDNNGWIRLEPDGRNLPKINSSVIYYKVCYQESEGFYKTIDDRHQYNAFQLEEMFRNGDKFSHFKLIEKEKYPIW